MIIEDTEKPFHERVEMIEFVTREGWHKHFRMLIDPVDGLPVAQKVSVVFFPGDRSVPYEDFVGEDSSMIRVNFAYDTALQKFVEV